MKRFTRFVGIDWSGAKGSRHPGIAVALCDAGTTAPYLVEPPGRHWSRQAVAGWLLDQRDDALIGIDFSFAPPMIARGSYFPDDETAFDAKALWAYVDRICGDEDLGAASLLDVTHRRHFYFGAADGRKADFVHRRVCEAQNHAAGGGKISTIYEAIGAAQVAKASFSGMRLLHAVNRGISIWPFDRVPEHGPVIVEIYTKLAARAAGLAGNRSKIRDAPNLDRALSTFGSEPHAPLVRYTDHATDAILTAAWLRANADREELWRPEGLTPEVAGTEGWTFGIT